MTGTPILQNASSTIRLAVEVAWGADLTDLDGSGWTWSDITTDVQLNNGWGVDIQIGRADESNVTQPAVLTVTLDNTAGAYSLGGQSSNYPNVRVGTPVRVRVSTNSGSTWLVKFQGNAVGWTPNWDTTGKWATVVLTASGPLRQINQGTLPATSYYAQAIPTLTGSGQVFEGLQYYWNNENGNGVEGPTASDLSACYPTYPTGVTSATDARVLVPNGNYLPSAVSAPNGSAFPCAGLIPTAWDFGTYNATLPATTNTGKLLFRWMCSLSSLSGTQTQPLLYWRTSASSTLLWAIMWNQAGNLWVQNGTDSAAGNNYVGTAVGFGGTNKVWYFNLQQSTSGSSSLIRLDVLSFDGTSGGFSWTATGSTTGYLTHANFVAPSAATPVLEAHMTVQNVLQGTTTALTTFWQGNPGESVTARLTRIANNANIPITIVTDTATETSTNPADTMGGQYYDTLSNLVRECEATGNGVLFDGLGIGLTYVTRLLRESQQPLMTVDASASPSAVVMPFAPTFDDQGVINQMSVSRRNGGTYTYTDTTSANLIGVYSSSITINQEDDSGLAAMAQWFVHVGVPSGYRYPTFTFELEKVPSLIASWLTCFPGCRIDVTNISSARSQHPTGTIRNVLEGWQEQISQHQWKVTANTTSYEKWKVIKLAAATGTTTDTLGRYESDGSTVTSSVSAGATSISVTTSSGPKWTTSSVTADDFPLVVEINGRPITVTAISSTTSPQTFTVNAVPAAISAGSAVTVYQNAVLGM